MDSPLFVIGIGAIVFGVLLIACAVAIAVFIVDWPAIHKARTSAKPRG